MESVTIKDVARLCGVAVSTVSRAINNHPDINKETREMIMKVIEEHNYIPNNSARNLKRTDSKTIALLMKGISNPFFHEMVETFEQAIKQMRHSFIIQRVEENEDEILLALELEKEKKLRGVIILGGFNEHGEEQLLQIKIPYVFCTTGIVGELGRQVCSSVSIDDLQESYKLTDYLCKAGHKKIAILAARKDDISIGRQRLRGYRRALADNGLIYDEELVVFAPQDIVPFSMENGYNGAKKLLDEKKEFTALYAISDNMAFGACRAIVDAGKRVPEDYSVAGFDGIDMGAYYCPSLTTIRQPRDEMALEAVKLLFDLIYKRSGHEHKVFEGKLILRESTRELS